jgi:hypothetical protein
MNSSCSGGRKLDREMIVFVRAALLALLVSRRRPDRQV